MGKPRLLILIRHAQSEGNKNRDIHQTIPDHRVKLTQDGWQQAYEAGRRLRAMLRADDTLHFFTSPYRRTRETTEGILATLTSDDPEPSPFKRSKIKVYEEPRLREQDFGNFQPCSAEMERMWQERADYGHFFYRIPNGESAADAYDRVSGFNESLWRQFGEDDFASVCVLVTHGLMSRVFLMKWYHFSVEYFEDLRNINHCEFLIMRKQEESGKYILENKLRTWSELKRERALRAAKEAKEGSKDGTTTAAAAAGTGRENGNSSKDSSKLDKALLNTSSPVTSSPVEVRRRWGGCPNGCNHDKSFQIRQTLADLVKSDSTISSAAAAVAANRNESGLPSERPNGSGSASTAASLNGLVVIKATETSSVVAVSTSLAGRRPAARRFQSSGDEESGGQGLLLAGPQIDITKSRDEVVSSPDGTPSYISVEDRLRGHMKSPNEPPPPRILPLMHTGRDFGGTHSGHNSLAASDADSSEDDHPGHRSRLRLNTQTSSGLGTELRSATPHHHRERDQSAMGRGTRANRLGDHPHSSDGEHHDHANDSDHEADVEFHDDDHDDDSHHSHHHHEEDQDHGTPPKTELNELTNDELARVSTLEINEAEREDKSVAGSVY